MTDGVGRRTVSDALDGAVSGLAGRTLEQLAAKSQLGAKLYWTASERYYRSRCAGDVDAYPSPPDPFKLEWVDPDRIPRHTRRRYPPWKGRARRFGEVRGGEWDRRDRPDVDPAYRGPPPELFVADRFEESVLYRSSEAHFDRGVDWEETPLFADLKRLIRTDDREYEYVWHGCRSVEDVRSRFRYLDGLYDAIRQDGFRSQWEMVLRDPERGFRDWFENEITVDVGRDGELLLVCGKHRLTIAKLLGVDRIPVLFLVRHPEWMARRREALRTPPAADHPDLRDVPTGA